VSINCDFDVKEVYWLLQKLPDSPVVILVSCECDISNESFENVTIACKKNLKKYESENADSFRFSLSFISFLT